MGVQMKNIIVNFNLIIVFCDWIGLRLNPSQTEACTWPLWQAILKRCIFVELIADCSCEKTEPRNFFIL